MPMRTISYPFIMSDSAVQVRQDDKYFAQIESYVAVQLVHEATCLYSAPSTVQKNYCATVDPSATVPYSNTASTYTNYMVACSDTSPNFLALDELSLEGFDT